MKGRTKSSKSRSGIADLNSSMVALTQPWNQVSIILNYCSLYRLDNMGRVIQAYDTERHKLMHKLRTDRISYEAQMAGMEAQIRHYRKVMDILKRDGIDPDAIIKAEEVFGATR